MRPIGEDHKKIDEQFVADVESYIDDNKLKFGCVDELTPQEFFQFYLNWNGIIGYHDSIISLMQQLGWELKQSEPRIMTDEHRNRIIELIEQTSSDMLMDSKIHEVVETCLQYERDGVHALTEASDEDLLKEVGGDFTDDAGNFVAEDFDPTVDEAGKIWCIYNKPEILCKVCVGAGAIYDLGEPHDCPTCNGSGLADKPLQPKFTVVRERTVFEHCDVRAENPAKAAEIAKKSIWTEHHDDLVKLEVFTPEAAEEPLVPNAAEPLYSES